MASVSKINKKLAKAFEGFDVQAQTENGCLVLNGELERWSQVVMAGMIALHEKPDINIVNNIKCTADKPLPLRKPRLEDTQLDGEEPDVLIIGGGIIGCAIARELSRYSLSIILIEKEHDLGMHATGRSAGIVHSGAGLRRGTQKLWYTKLGGKKLAQVCSELSVPYHPCGQYIVYTNHLGKPFLYLAQLFWRICGIKGVERLSGDELRAKQPGVNGNISSALFFPNGGVVCPQTLAAAYAENSVKNGAHIVFNTIALEMTVEEGIVTSVATNRGTLRPKIVINAAGSFCEDIAAMADDRFYSTHPVKNTGIMLNKKYASDYVNAVVTTSGTILDKIRKRRTGNSNVLRNTNGNVVAGYAAMETINKEDFSTDRFSVDRAIEQAKRVIPGLERDQVQSYMSSINSSTYEGDFIVRPGKAATNMIHAAGIQYPGVTASPAIADEVTRLVVEMFGGSGALPENPDFDPIRQPPPVIRDMELGEREAMIDTNPNFGIVVCRCEQVTRGEIIDVLGRGITCDSLDGIRQRTGAGGGMCQGACCTPAILETIAAERRVSPQNIRKSSLGSELIYGSAAENAVKTHAEHKTHVVPLFSDEHEKHESDEELLEKLKKAESL